MESVEEDGACQIVPPHNNVPGPGQPESGPFACLAAKIRAYMRGMGPGIAHQARASYGGVKARLCVKLSRTSARSVQPHEVTLVLLEHPGVALDVQLVRMEQGPSY